MTEQEATTKWCPHMTYCVNPHHVMDGLAAEYVQARCCASECMMWRWDGEVGLWEGDLEGASGYCGLAGRP